ncbi:zeta toxin family protein [Sulfurimonas sp.]|uniref:zeta toxin family protein n=1 Tax=Sulfurimonas sp. TaxID=2022749 RepID=UPI002635C120|nr:zeta toxin family protein [Sulfurimonas sp.]
MNTPRLRMFAGPNGSGKSTLNTIISKELLGVYINPDEIEKEIKKFDFLDLSKYEIVGKESEVLSFFNAHPLLELDDVSLLKFSDNKIDFFNIVVNSYYASVCADFIRHQLLNVKISFTFETVMSSRDKVEFLKKAQEAGYRTYLYFIATKDPIINISRVQNRVKKGGHPVPKEKIVSRYYRSLELLSEALKYSNRAYIFDNSSQERLWIAQVDNANEFVFKSEIVPVWVEEYLLNVK